MIRAPELFGELEVQWPYGPFRSKTNSGNSGFCPQTHKQTAGGVRRNAQQSGNKKRAAGAGGAEKRTIFSTE